MEPQKDSLEDLAERACSPSADAWMLLFILVIIILSGIDCYITH